MQGPVGISSFHNQRALKLGGDNVAVPLHCVWKLSDSSVVDALFVVAGLLDDLQIDKIIV